MLDATSTFCSAQAIPGNIVSMGSSPFHGIFSALGNNDGRRSVFPFGSEDPVGGPAMPQQPLQQRQDPQGNIGRVAVDISEQDEYYIIKAPIAGVRLSDLDIEVNENVITIRGSRRQTDMIPGGQYFLQECFWGPFARSITLPMQIDPRKIRATFNKECILKILIPKEEKVKVVKISEV